MYGYTQFATRLTLVWVFVLTLGGPARADQQDLSAEIEHYSKIFAGTAWGPKKQAINELAWKGISAPEVWSPVEAELLASYKTVTDKDKAQVEQLSWLAKGLAQSGDMKYATPLEDMLAGTPSKKFKKHLTTALQRLPNYAKWNPVISANLAEAPAGQLDQARTLNMLSSDSPDLIRAGAKVARKQFADEATVTAAVNESLLKNYNRNLDNKVQVDAVNHLIRTLGESGMSEYRGTLDKVATSSNKKIAKYAVKYAGYL